ncbi:hypothetical protein F511_26641 [Dorcoceras hygrometricum]|uniref:Uncharacterized protein n=1 Tax=Dorcoceras hygrometricum TaxID=472368 RepID=A0A2Z7D6I0_9LAMI|nr:hypothetical protein F511_26641 [Dorcoceras hygrometricum]
MTSAFLLLRRAGISNDDVSSDVITISRWIRRSAKEKLLTDEKNKGEVELLSASQAPLTSYCNEGEPAVARSVVTNKRQQLSEQLLNNLLEHIQLLGCNQRSRWKEAMAEIDSCKCLKSRGQVMYYSGK